MGLFDNRKVDRVQKFENIEFSSKEEKRDTEEKLLQPEAIEPYTGELPKYSNELESRTALIVFKDKAQMDLIGTLFSIRESCSGKSYITNIELLEHIARCVREGSMYVHNEMVHMAGAKDDTEKLTGIDFIHKHEEIPEKPMIKPDITIPDMEETQSSFMPRRKLS